MKEDKTLIWVKDSLKELEEEFKKELKRTSPHQSRFNGIVGVLSFIDCFLSDLETYENQTKKSK